MPDRLPDATNTVSDSIPDRLSDATDTVSDAQSDTTPANVCIRGVVSWTAHLYH
jgi:hypothetical protein